MQSKRLAAQPQGHRSYAVVFETDDDVIPDLQGFFISERVASARLYGIGGFRRATLGYYDMDERRYVPIEIDEQVEVVSFVGNVTSYDDSPRLHAHVVVSRRDGRTCGGHLLTAVVRPTLELMLHELPSRIIRVDRPEVGIPLIDLCSTP